MNYLAHLFLSPKVPEEMIGNFIADIIRSSEEKLLPEKVSQGIALHRFIDHKTDHHPIFKDHRKKLYPFFSKYAGVVLDIYYDYLLSLNWEEVTNETFEDFEKRIYNTLRSNSDLAPDRIKPIIDHMIRDRWLDVYTSIDGMERVFARMQKKVSFKVEFENAMEVLDGFLPHWKDDHLIFFQEIQLDIKGFINYPSK